MNRCSPYDAPAEHEGANQGLVEALAERLWTVRSPAGRRGHFFRDQREEVRASWRHTAEVMLDYLVSVGFTGPGGPPRPDRQLVYGWAYDVNNWSIYDQGRGFVASVAYQEDVPLFLAAPQMAEAIRTVLTRADRLGGIKRSDLDALREALPAEPQP